MVAEAGEILSASPWAAPPGTQVEVAELFFNTPARQKFLKSPEAEQAQILGALRHLALGYPQVHFSLGTPTRALLTAPAAPSLLERVAAVFTPELAGHMLPLSWPQGAWQVTGLTTEPDYNLASARFQVFLVNGRVVADRILGAVLREVYAGLLPRGRHPAAVVNLTAAPRGRGRQRPPRQDRNSLPRAGQGLPAPPRRPCARPWGPCTGRAPGTG